MVEEYVMFFGLLRLLTKEGHEKSYLHPFMLGFS
jgi:hypothetical protein